MKTIILAAGISAFVIPAMANAQGFGLRLGLETPVYTHFDQNGQSGSFSIGDSFQPTINVLAEYYVINNVGLGIEFKEGFLATGTLSNCVGNNCGYQRTGTSIGPNLTLDLNPVPIYVRAAVPIHVEPDPVRIDFRAAGGLKIGINPIALYLEVLADFPLAGSGVSAFSRQQLGAGAGLWFKF